MRLSLKTKFTAATSLLVLLVVTVVSTLYLARLSRQTLRQANDTALFVAQQIYDACGNALKEAAERGETPASPDAANHVIPCEFPCCAQLWNAFRSALGVSCSQLP